MNLEDRESMRKVYIEDIEKYFDDIPPFPRETIWMQE